MMRSTTRLVTLLAFVLESYRGPVDPAHMSLADDPIQAREVWVTLSAIEIHRTGSGWVSFGPDATFVDLIKLQGGQVALLEEVTLPSGEYTQIRVTVGSGYAIDLDGTRCELQIPGGQVIFETHFDIDEEPTTRLLLDFDAEQSIFIHSTGHERECVLHPVIRPVRVTTGR